MDEFAEIKSAVIALQDALNKSGKNFNVTVQKLDTTHMADEREHFLYIVNAEVIQPI